MNLTPNITAKELGVDNLTTDSREFQMALLVADNLQAVRDYYSLPINVHCGYRNERHNSSVGGVATSQHIYAEAADFNVVGINCEQVFNDIKNGNITLPHKVSQVILEESKLKRGQWGWVHLAVFTNRWEESRAKSGRKHDGHEMMLCINDGYHEVTNDATEVVAVV